ncbi:MAG: MCE family protein [Candidatus Omnitrophica bacterium]|nr:MCE family protein [Candidatus Omnitrophota bacterium]
MRETKSFDLKVGLFVSIGIIIFFIIIFSIGDFTIVTKGYRIITIFNFINGLSESAPVRLAGVNVGYVDNIRLYYDETAKRTRVKVSAWIQDDMRVEKDSRASINTLGLLGEKYLEITPGSAESGILKKNEELIGHDPIMMDQLTEKLSNLADSADTIMTGVKDGKGTIGKLLTDDTIYNDLEAFVKDIKAHPWKLFKKR